MKNVIELQSKRLLLRPFEIDDAPAVQKLAGDKRISDTTLDIPYPYEDGLAEEWISTHAEKREKGEEFIFAITANGEVVGAICLKIRKEFNSGEIGYWIGVPFWNHGYATEAVAAILKFAFRELDLHRVHAHHMSNNTASGRVMLKNEMQLEGRLRQHIFKNGKFHDAVLYGILKNEWLYSNKS